MPTWDSCIKYVKYYYRNVYLYSLYIHVHPPPPANGNSLKINGIALHVSTLLIEIFYL